MARWEPNARERLEEAAMALFVAGGYADTTVGDIAAKAGLTERTFFRHFSDKREVLFSGSETFETLMVETVRDAPADASPLDAMGLALDAAATFVGRRGDGARQRQDLLEANAELQERELIKVHRLGRSLADALRERGVPELEARVTAETGLGVMRAGIAHWHAHPDGPELHDVLQAGLHVVRERTGHPAP